MNWKKIICIAILVLCFAALIANAIWVPLGTWAIRAIGVVMIITLVILYREPRY